MATLCYWYGLLPLRVRAIIFAYVTVCSAVVTQNYVTVCSAVVTQNYVTVCSAVVTQNYVTVCSAVLTQNYVQGKEWSSLIIGWQYFRVDPRSHSSDISLFMVNDEFITITVYILASSTSLKIRTLF
jgi:hypothetical protein